MFLLMNCHALLLFFLFCSLSLGAKEVLLTENDKEKHLMLQTGDIVRIDLFGNPTTGYTWEVSSQSTCLLDLLENSYSPASSLVGSGGTFTFRFQAKSCGSANLSILYLRPWEKEEPPLDRFYLTVDILSPTGESSSS